MKKSLILGILLFNSTFVKADEGYCEFGMMGFGNGGYGMFFGILFWVIILYLIFLLIKNINNSNNNALNILKKRYVKGEITKKEFERMKRELN